MKIRLIQRSVSYRKRIAIISVGLVIGFVSLLFSANMSKQLREKEKSEVALWSYAMERIGEVNTADPLVYHILNNQKIPFMLTDENGNVEESHLIPNKVLSHPDLKMKMMIALSRQNEPLEINAWNGRKFMLFYGNSPLLKWLIYFPYGQILVIAIFFAFGFITFRTSKQDEQNRVWIGLAKETAHQLGTPISSLLGWMEYLRGQNIDPTAIDEMSKDLTRLVKVADRFSKIGSETELSPANINEVVGSCVQYFLSRVPKNVTLTYNGLAMAPVRARINSALFEWVVENLLKNSLDALQGQGSIDVRLSDDNSLVFIDVTDSGKGIPKANWKRIFEPGFTTKTRGWGLGLSLSKRIIEEYHKGRIYVADSEIGRGTTIRIEVNKSDD